MKANNTSENKLNFTRNRQTCKNALQEFHVNKIKDICNKKNIKHFYDYVNRNLGRVKSSIMLKDDRRMVIKDTIRADMFAKFFQSVFSIDEGKLPNVDKKIKSCLSDM